MLPILFAFTLHLPAQEHPHGDSWFGADKAKHFLVSAFVESVGYTSARYAGMDRRAAMLGAAAVTAAVGVGKELHDRHVGGDFSVQDLTWDAAGGLAAGLLLGHTRD